MTSSTRHDGGPRDVIVISHLRWTWVWQRPQQLISRLPTDARIWFVEVPLPADVEEPRLRWADVGPVRRVWLEIPYSVATAAAVGGGVGFEVTGADCYTEALKDLLAGAGRGSDVWLYTPMGLQMAEALQPRVLVYDVMDDLSAFADGGPGMGEAQRAALRQADLVFAGGQSLHRMATAVRGAQDTHLFPSGVDIRHYASSRKLRGSLAGRRPVAGYVGVIDERLDLALLGDLAAALPGWDVHMVGPIAKIDPADVPRADNVHYLGMQPYDRLPGAMAAMDVALMPFALNEATRAISPTKTLEYLAAGLPVVSTRVPDVVADWSNVVHLADTTEQFAAACREVVDHSVEIRDAKAAPLRRRHEWDTIAGRMAQLLDQQMQVARTLDVPA